MIVGVADTITPHSSLLIPHSNPSAEPTQPSGCHSEPVTDVTGVGIRSPVLPFSRRRSRQTAARLSFRTSDRRHWCGNPFPRPPSPQATNSIRRLRRHRNSSLLTPNSSLKFVAAGDAAVRLSVRASAAALAWQSASPVLKLRYRVSKEEERIPTPV